MDSTNPGTAEGDVIVTEMLKTGVVAPYPVKWQKIPHFFHTPVDLSPACSINPQNRQ